MAAEAVLAIVALIVVVLLLMLVTAMRLVPATLSDEGNDEESDHDDGPQVGGT